MNKNIKIGFIGAGTMGKAIINGIINSGFVSKENIFASEISVENAEKISKELGIKVYTDNNELVKTVDIIVLCTKPFVITQVLSDIREYLSEGKIVVSIAAGISTEQIENTIEKKVPVIRVMPNTPALISEGMSAVCGGRYSNQGQIEIVKSLFSRVGKCIEVQERLINAVTGISGSGPAFIYLIIEALADGGVKLGLPKNIALELAAQTTLGAAKMVIESGKHPALLKDEVTTPGGCTIAGLSVMEELGVRAALINTVEQTAKVAQDLANK